MSRPAALRALVVLLLVLWTAALLPVSALPAASTPSVIVQFAPAAAVTPAADWRAVYGQPNTFAVPAATAKLDEWAKRPDVLRVEPNPIVTLSDPPRAAYDDAIMAAQVNDPLAPQQYSLTRMNVPAAWDVARGDGITVAIVDTGADFTHPDLAGKFVSRGMDFVTGHPDAADDHGHGTHTAGIAAAATANGVGVAGVGFNARLLPVKALAASGSGSHASIASAIAWAADNGARVINLSLGSPSSSTTLETAINYAWNKGSLLTCAAGNDSTDTPSYPAAYPHCLSVVATDAADLLARFSNYGPTVDVAAPGVTVLSTVRGGGYEAWSGTSMAAPNAAGVAALVWSAHPTWTNAQVRAALETTADPIGPANSFGHGRLNAGRAAGNASPAPLPTSPAPQPTPAPDDYEALLASLINAERVNAGKAALVRDVRLEAAADFHNRWMLDHTCFLHECPGEPGVYQRIRDAGYPLLGGSENIGLGYQTPQDMVTGWMNSSGHRANILGEWTDLGCGFLQGASGSYRDRYWTCDFGKSAGGPQPTVVVPPTRFPPPTLTPSGVQPTPRPPYPPEGWTMRIELVPSAGWSLWDRAYYEICGRSGVTCEWYKR